MPLEVNDHEDHWAVVANLIECRNGLRIGAKCWVVNANPGWGGERVQVEVFHGGRKRFIQLWLEAKLLMNFRVKWSFQERRGVFPSKESAQEWADFMNSSRAGKLPEDT